MKDVVERLDDALIDRVFQPLADWLDHHIAFGIFRAARGAIDLASLMWICAEARDASAAARYPGLMLFHFAVIVAGLWSLSTLRGLFPRTKGAREGGANPLRAAMQLHRAACLFWMIGLAIKTASAPNGFEALALFAVGVFATSAVYLGACSTPPPKPRESRTFAWSASKAL